VLDKATGGPVGLYLSENKKEAKAVEDPTEKLHMKLLQLKNGNVNPESYVFSLAETFPAGAAILRVVPLRDTLLRLLSHGKIWQMSPPMAPEWITKHYLRIHGGVRSILPTYPIQNDLTVIV
jgi:hypothetical protein